MHDVIDPSGEFFNVDVTAGGKTATLAARQVGDYSSAMAGTHGAYDEAQRVADAIRASLQPGCPGISGAGRSDITPVNLPSPLSARARQADPGTALRWGGWNRLAG